MSAGTNVGPDQPGSLTLDRRKKMIPVRLREIILALISQLTLVKLAQTLNSFGLKKLR